MEDREILELFRQRDQRAIPALEERYGGRLRALSLRLLGSPEDAEECVSDTYLAAWNAIPPEEPVYLFAYLAAICRNRVLSALGREKAQKRRGEVVALTAELEQCIPDTAKMWERPAWRRSVSAWTERLPLRPISMACKKAAVSPSKMRQMVSFMARLASSGSQRQDPEVPGPKVSSPRE